MNTKIYVSKHNIEHNRKHGTDEPVFIVKDSDGLKYARSVLIHGPSLARYIPGQDDGGDAWIETDAPVSSSL